MEKQEKALFAEFPPITDEQWRQQVLQDLKGAGHETLEWPTVEGITVKPYYRSGQPILQIPVRPVGAWLVSQGITIADATTANATALDALQRGATSLLFTCNAPVDLDVLLKDILIEHIHTDWEIAPGAEKILINLAALIKNRGLEPVSVKGSVHYQPTAKVAYYQQYRQLLPGFQLFTIPASIAETLTEQTAAQLAEANNIIQELTKAGYNAAEVLPHIRFNIEVGTDHFFEIARIRVLRALWMVVCRQYEVDYQTPAFIHATNKKVSPEKDGYYEMIRQTTQALSAVIGGADSLSIIPHIATPDRGIGFQTRIARNVQLILQHESHLDTVADPAAGSWYLEALTTQLAEQVWVRFVALTQPH